MTEPRHVRLYAYLSSKGGVGKSTLAVATAWLAASTPGREAVLVDLDLWGSSLGDGLPLCAPKVPVADGLVLDLEGPASGEFMSRRDTVRARHARRFSPIDDGSRPEQLTYTNDALYAAARGDVLAAPIEHFLWRLDGPAGDLPLRVVPSSPLRDDLERVAGWMADLDALPIWAARVWWLVQTLIAHRPRLTDIVCDLPPGLVGLPLPFLALIGAHASGRPQPDGFPKVAVDVRLEILPAFVTTPDLNALAITAEAFLFHQGDVPGLSLIVNRGQGGRDAVRTHLEAHFEPFFEMDPYQLHRQCVMIDERREMQFFARAFSGLGALDGAGLAALRRGLRVHAGEP